MAVDSNVRSNDRKLPMHTDQYHEDDRSLKKSRRLLQTPSILYPILLVLLLIGGTALLVITLTRRNTCRQLLEERIESSLEVLPKDHTPKWVPCVKITKSSSCACPASYIHSSVNPSHCIPSHSRCLQSCKTNIHCVCYHLTDPYRCREVTQNWAEKQFHIGSVEPIHDLKTKNASQYPWSDDLYIQIEDLLVDTRSGERLFFSSDRRTGITIHEHDDKHLFHERWTKIEANTTHQHIAYTHINPDTRSCRMSAIHSDGSVTHGPIQACPSFNTGAPYFLGVACQDILVLWQGGKQLKIRRQEGWALSRHHFESIIPRVPVLLDPFHRYYSLYDDLMIEIKDLNGDVLAQLFTDIHNAIKFEFIDQYGTILVANQTHMQLLKSTNQEAWLDI